MPQHQIVDLESLVKERIKKFPFDKKEQDNMDKILPTDINWKNVAVFHGETTYSDASSFKKPNSHILFTANFENRTDHVQKHSLKTERRTKSTCTLKTEKAYSIGSSFQLKLVPPNPVIDANAGFHGSLNVSKMDEETFEEELVWAVDSQVSVQPGYKTSANLVIREEEYIGSFTSETSFQGLIHVTLRNKKDQSEMKTMTIPVTQVFTAEKGFTCDGVSSIFVNTGECRCRFGIEQKLTLAEEKLEENVEENTED
ncbi:Hypothetical predicted protein [Octopus vulgaris]|uniref:Uncharacterized protein n=1 Tax=Octopus vulgaris TaxID=6645 RepID=A0AA36AUM0_OCTVU|nr:Hypothetical predicted protein [Octopus vulgaris]